jgi:hypothetical protein
MTELDENNLAWGNCYQGISQTRDIEVRSGVPPYSRHISCGCFTKNDQRYNEDLERECIFCQHWRGCTYQEAEQELKARGVTVKAVQDKESVKLSEGEIFYDSENNPAVKAFIPNRSTCPLVGTNYSGIPGRSTHRVCPKYTCKVRHAGIKRGTKECILCEHWTGAPYREVIKALDERENPRQKKPFNRFAEIDFI